MSIIKVDYGDIGGGDLVFTDTGVSSLASYTIPDNHKGMLIVLYRAGSDPWLKLNGTDVTAIKQTTVSGGARVWVYEINDVKSGQVITSDYTNLAYAGFIDN